jgi:hypothetical protein
MALEGILPSLPPLLVQSHLQRRNLVELVEEHLENLAALGSLDCTLAVVGLEVFREKGEADQLLR